MTYFFNVKDYGLEGHLFKIVNVNLSKEIQKIKDNAEQVRDVQQYPVDYESMIIVVEYKKKESEIFFFKSIGYGLKKYNEIRKAIGIYV